MALIHGGDTEGFLLEYGREPLDFSANCNPLGIPASVPQAIFEAAAHADKYPDPLCRRLRGSLAEKLDIPPEQILFGNGAADLIFRLALAKKTRTALVTAPTFAEYELALETIGCRIIRHQLQREDGFALTEGILDRISPDIEMMFICNPNNPTGLTVEHELLLKILDACEKNGTLLIVDECFNGFLDDPIKHTLKKSLSKSNNLLILDAFTKLYGMAGVRLGHCMSKNVELLGALKNAGQPWSVSTLAQAAGLAALSEDEYVTRSRALVKAERTYLLGALAKLGFVTFGGAANYIFFYSDLPALTEQLRRSGILIRDCSNYQGLRIGYYRVAVRTHSENEQLISALAQLT